MIIQVSGLMASAVSRFSLHNTKSMLHNLFLLVYISEQCTSVKAEISRFT